MSTTDPDAGTSGALVLLQGAETRLMEIEKELEELTTQQNSTLDNMKSSGNFDLLSSVQDLLQKIADKNKVRYPFYCKSVGE